MCVTAPPALAEPVGSGQVATNPTLGLRDLGANTTLSFYGLQGTQSLTIPVPPGLAPVALIASVELPFNLRAGTVAVIQDDRTVSRVDLPNADLVPIRLPLAGAEVRDNAITVLLRTNLMPPEGYCITDPANPLRLNDTAIEFPELVNLRIERFLNGARDARLADQLPAK